MQITEDDGLALPEVGTWAERKYKLVRLYDSLFSTGMKNSWDQRIYIDLYAGPGKVKLRGTNKIVLGSPLIAAGVADKFSRYIFCDSEEANIEALRKRVMAAAPTIDAHFLIGDSNCLVDDILHLLPKASKSNRVLSFCFVDPFDLGIEFATLRSLSNHYMDFLVLLALSMDGHRNEKYYTRPTNGKIAAFLGMPQWRDHWRDTQSAGDTFRRFLATSFASQMVALGYNRDSLQKMIEVRSGDRNLPLYHLAFFSRHERGYKFWKEVRKYSETEPTLFDD